MNGGERSKVCLNQTREGDPTELMWPQQSDRDGFAEVCSLAHPPTLPSGIPTLGEALSPELCVFSQTAQGWCLRLCDGWDVTSSGGMEPQGMCLLPCVKDSIRIVVHCDAPMWPVSLSEPDQSDRVDKTVFRKTKLRMAAKPHLPSEFLSTFSEVPSRPQGCDFQGIHQLGEMGWKTRASELLVFYLGFEKWFRLPGGHMESRLISLLWTLSFPKGKCRNNS